MRPPLPPALLVYVEHTARTAVVQGVGAGAVVLEVIGLVRRRPSGYYVPERAVPQIVACARGWGGSCTVAHADGSTCARLLDEGG